VDVGRRDRDQLGVGAVRVLADHGDPIAVLEPRVDQYAPPGVVHAGAVGAEDSGLRYRGQPPAHPDVQMVQRRGAQVDEDVVGPRLRIGRILVAQHLGPAVLVDPDRFHGARS
jgi:hypothetical protein